MLLTHLLRQRVLHSVFERQYTRVIFDKQLTAVTPNTLRKIMSSLAKADEALTKGKGKDHKDNVDDTKTTNDAKPVLKHLRYKKKRDGNLPPPAMVDVQVIGTGGMASPKTVLINTDHNKYLFNCGEGTQRIVMEQKMRISRTENIFITSNKWENISGLLGMCLSLEGACQVPNVRIHGPPGVENLVTMSRGFSQLHVIDVEKQEVHTGFYEDTVIKVDYIYFKPNTASEEDHEEPVEKKQKREPDDNDMAVAYLMIPKPKQRSLSLEKCVDMGVSAIGKHVADLKEEKSITLDDGRIIHPDDVLNPAESNNGILVVECPDKRYVDSFINHDKLPSCLDLIVHFSKPTIMNCPKYRSWMNSFPDSTQHFIVNEESGNVSFLKLYENQAILNQIHSDIFSLLYQQRDADANKTADSVQGNVIYGKTNMRVIYRGGVKAKKGSVYQDDCIHLNNEAFIQKSLEETDYTKELSDLKALEGTITNTGGKKYPEVLFTGTGSSIPNKGRNVSGMCLTIERGTRMLLDCGEDTYGQLLRFYGPDRITNVLKEIKAIFISHLHADHHMGLIGMLKAWAEAQKADCHLEPILLLAPNKMNEWLDDVNRHITGIRTLFKMVPLEKLGIDQQLNEEVCKRLNVDELKGVPVVHRQYPHGIVITTNKGYKLVYSGDTIPCNKLVNAGRNCDLLIHEATMEDDLAYDAAKKKHSTTSQAIDVGKQMNAKFTLLTHFSQRYAKIPMFHEGFTDNVGVAFDNMIVKPKLLQHLPAMLPLLKVVFAEDYAELESKQQRRQFQREMELENSDKGKKKSDEMGTASGSECAGMSKKQAKKLRKQMIRDLKKHESAKNNE